MSALSLEHTLYPEVTPGDRLGLTLCVAVVLHAMVLLGISFAPEPPTRLRAEGLEVTLVAQKSRIRPKNPDLLAQVNASGSGSGRKIARPSPAAAVPQPDSAPPTPTTLPLPPFAAPEGSETEREERMLTVRPEKPIAAPHPAHPPAKLTRLSPTSTVLAEPTPDTHEPTVTATPGPVPEATPPPKEPASALPTAEQLITRSFAMASLHAELEQRLETKAHRARTRYVSATTQEYRYAAYMEAWRAKVERIGNLNYPDEARKDKLSGTLLLDVSLAPDGHVVEIVVRRSSGHRVLDDAAVRIVELAGPYAAFPEDIRREVDILHVTRTWKFLSNEAFQAQ